MIVKKKARRPPSNNDRPQGGDTPEGQSRSNISIILIERQRLQGKMTVLISGIHLTGKGRH